MTRDEELLANGSREEQADTVAAFLELQGWLTYAQIVRNLSEPIDNGEVERLAAQYEDQAKFADIDYAVIYREFARKLRAIKAMRKA